MLQSPEVLGLPSELRETLSSLMPGAALAEEALRDGSLPVVVMLHGHAVTAFALGEESDFEPLYEAFKKHYLKRTAEWSTKDVSFVFCLPAGIPGHESFRSRVEVDVYFCRKYVVQLDGDLATSLARLPFLPLRPITPGVQTRPPSAQTLLRQRNLRADLAAALVVPSRSSASAILNACIEGSYGLPGRLESKSAVEPVGDGDDGRATATLKSISIENFRAYRTKREFSLGKAVTVLYGPNGFGKTSLFDAIDFAVTGGVKRLEKANGGLAKAAKHLDSGAEPTVVSLTIEREGKQHVITRTLTDPTNARVDGKVTTRKDVLSLLTGGASAASDRVDNMVDLFRATHLFNQDSQELTGDVGEKCELPADIVSRMLAFEDYVSGSKKTEEVLKLARQMLVAARKEVQEARKSVETEREELKRLEGIASASGSPEALEARFSELEQAITAAQFNTAGIDARDTRALRAMLESSAAEAARQRGVVSKAHGDVGSLRTSSGQIEPLRAQVAERRLLLDQATITANTTSERVDTLTTALAEAKAQEQTVRNQRDWLAWAVSVHPEFAQLATQREADTRSLAELTQRLTAQKAVQAKASGLQQESAAALKRLEAALKTASETRSRVQSVTDFAALWANAALRLQATQVQETQLQAFIDAKRAQLADAQQAISSQELLVARVERELGTARSNDTALKQLIAELRAHVNGATCPLCGHDHGTQDKLLAAIDQRLEQGDRIVQLSESLAAECAKLATQVAARQTLVDGLAQDQQRHSQAKSDRTQLEQQRAVYEEALQSIGLLLSDDATRQLEQAGSEALEAEKLAAEAVANAKQMLAKAETELASANVLCQATERERQTVSTSLEDSKQRIDAIAADASRGSINLDSAFELLKEALQNSENALGQASNAMQSARTALDAQKVASAGAKASVSGARNGLQQAEQALNAQKTNVESLVAALTAAGFGGDVTEEQLLQQIREATAREAAALGLRDRVAELEVAVDTAATSAAFQNIRDRIQANEKIADAAEARAQKVEPWIEYFSDVAKLLASQQAVATSHFITEYGPRTAVIQQRLRPVYGFGEIQVSSKNSAISVRVQRNGEELRPPDYFSQSQVQTLVLGLFLTACSSQTWSGFSSIMMDDPVTHFDDLNTYALLDLISGLQSSSEGDRQFVISTCDEKLLQLARQKFRHMGAAAKFYRFSALGAEGPLVSEIPG